MPRRGVRILPEDQDANLGEGASEGTQNVLPGGKIVTPVGEFGAQHLAHRSYLLFDGLQRCGPTAFDDILQGLRSHAVTLSYS